MRSWSCNATVVGGKYIGEVKAETREEALELAWDLPNAHVSLCHQCSHDINDPEIESIEVEEVEEGEED